MESLTELEITLGQLRVEFSALESENRKLKQDLSWFEKVVKIRHEILEELGKIEADTGIPMRQWIEEFLKQGVAMRSGQFKAMPVTSSVFEKLDKLARGRLQQIGQITTDEEFTSWVLYGYENGKF